MLRENTRNVRNFQEISNENRETVKYGIETRLSRTHFFGKLLPMNINWKLVCTTYIAINTCVGYAKIFSEI